MLLKVHGKTEIRDNMTHSLEEKKDLHHKSEIELLIISTNFDFIQRLIKRDHNNILKLQVLSSRV